MSSPLSQAFAQNFLGHSPRWYKLTVLAFLLLNPLLLWLAGPVTSAWVLVGEFIFTLAMALKCYPLQPGGLLVLEALLLGLATPEALYAELQHNFPVLLLLMFMVAGIYFMKDLLLLLFSRLLLGVRSKTLLSLLFCLLAALLSAFLDALTVTAVVISVAVAFFAVYHRVASGQRASEDYDPATDRQVPELHRAHLEEFRAFLRSLLMHAAVGTAGRRLHPGGRAAEPADRPRGRLAFRRVPPPGRAGIHAGTGGRPADLRAAEKSRRFGYGAQLPAAVRQVLAEYAASESRKRGAQQKAALLVQALAALVLIVGLALHVAEVGLIGLLVIVLITAFTGVTDEHQIGRAFQEALPFTALLVVFFAVVAVIHQQHLFTPIIQAVLALPAERQPGMLFIANGLLSAISDNVFVATIYITEVKQALDAGHMSREHFDTLAVAINTGTNLPSVATPNGQAAFLFLLTSSIAPLVRLSYGRMVWMALPYTLVMGGLGWWAVSHWL